jgi:hypothetical protein
MGIEDQPDNNPLDLANSISKGFCNHLLLSYQFVNKERAPLISVTNDDEKSSGRVLNSPLDIEKAVEPKDRYHLSFEPHDLAPPGDCGQGLRIRTKTHIDVDGRQDVALITNFN